MSQGIREVQRARIDAGTCEDPVKGRKIFVEIERLVLALFH